MKLCNPEKTIVPNRNLLFQGCKSSDSMSNFQGCKMYLFLCIFNMRDEISVCWFTRLYSHLHSRPKWQSAIWNEGFWVRSGNSYTTTFTLDFAQTDHSRILGAFFWGEIVWFRKFRKTWRRVWVMAVGYVKQNLLFLKTNMELEEWRFARWFCFSRGWLSGEPC